MKVMFWFQPTQVVDKKKPMSGWSIRWIIRQLTWRMSTCTVQGVAAPQHHRALWHRCLNNVFFSNSLWKIRLLVICLMLHEGPVIGSGQKARCTVGFGKIWSSPHHRNRKLRSTCWSWKPWPSRSSPHGVVPMEHLGWRRFFVQRRRSFHWNHGTRSQINPFTPRSQDFFHCRNYKWMHCQFLSHFGLAQRFRGVAQSVMSSKWTDSSMKHSTGGLQFLQQHVHLLWRNKALQHHYTVLPQGAPKLLHPGGCRKSWQDGTSITLQSAEDIETAETQSDTDHCGQQHLKQRLLKLHHGKRVACAVKLKFELFISLYSNYFCIKQQSHFI